MRSFMLSDTLLPCPKFLFLQQYNLGKLVLAALTISPPPRGIRMSHLSINEKDINSQSLDDYLAEIVPKGIH